MNTSIKNLKKQLFWVAISVLFALVALISATYAWFVSNTHVEGTTSTISAMSNSFVLQIASLQEGAQHGDNNQSLSATVLGGRITPSSTNDIKKWFVCDKWESDGKVHSYFSPSDLAANGQYFNNRGEENYAYLKSEYVLYTITDSGTCDVYLSPDELGKYITITQTSTGEAISTVPGSIRVGITIQELSDDGKTPNPDKDENLILVYAPENETGIGNDYTAIAGWTCVKDETDLMNVNYTYIYGTETRASDGNVYVASKNGETYSPPSSNGAKIASNVTYNGVCMRVYIWLEGTDAQCVNTTGEEDTSTYDVTVHLAGVAN